MTRHELLDYHDALANEPKPTMGYNIPRRQYEWGERARTHQGALACVKGMLTQIKTLKRVIKERDDWVPASERLPGDNAGEVLVWLKGGECALAYTFYDGWFTGRDGWPVSDADVTHWREVRGPTSDATDGGDGTWVPHVNVEGARNHFTYWDDQGPHCSEPRCELNKRDADEGVEG